MTTWGRAANNVGCCCPRTKLKVKLIFLVKQVPLSSKNDSFIKSTLIPNEKIERSIFKIKFLEMEVTGACVYGQKSDRSEKCNLWMSMP